MGDESGKRRASTIQTRFAKLRRSRRAACGPQVPLVIGAERRRCDGCGWTCAEGAIEWQRQRRHDGTLGICEHVVEYPALIVMRIAERIGEGTDRPGSTNL